MGVVGFGTIGTAVAQAFQRMGCRIGFYDPAPRDVAAVQALGARSMSLRELLAAADVVTLHVPLIAATRGMIGDAELAAMKPGAVLVQAARGGIVDEAALARHLASGHLGGAAVDVYSTEPPVADNPLLTLDRRGGAPAAADAAHRRRHAPIFGAAVPLRLAECRAGPGARRAAAPSRLLRCVQARWKPRAGCAVAARHLVNSSARWRA